MWPKPQIPKFWNIIQPLKKKMEILPFVRTWVKLEGITLSEIARQRKTNIV